MECRVTELLVDDVHTYYGDSYVLQGVSLSVRAGSVVAVLGRNGVGKTTLMRTIIAFTPARRGRVLFAGADVTRLPAYRIAQAGMALVPQGRRIFPSLTVRENLDLASGRSAGDGRPAEWTSIPSWTCSRACENGLATAPARSRAASSRCWPSGVH
jgi:branched-chain amino acid transport system ATP-binding protein